MTPAEALRSAMSLIEDWSRWCHDSLARVLIKVEQMDGWFTFAFFSGFVLGFVILHAFIG